MKVPTPLAHHSKTKAKGTKVLTSQEYWEDLEKERLKNEKEEQKGQKEEKAKLKTSGTSQWQKLLSVKAKGTYIYSKLCNIATI